MKNNYRILFMGTPDFALPALEALKAHGYMPIALYTQPDRINGRGNPSAWPMISPCSSLLP